MLDSLNVSELESSMALCDSVFKHSSKRITDYVGIIDSLDDNLSIEHVAYIDILYQKINTINASDKELLSRSIALRVEVSKDYINREIRRREIVQAEDNTSLCYFSLYAVILFIVILCMIPPKA